MTVTQSLQVSCMRCALTNPHVRPFMIVVNSDASVQSCQCLVDVQSAFWCAWYRLSNRLWQTSWRENCPPLSVYICFGDPCCSMAVLSVKGKVLITTDTSSDIDTVEFYIDGALKSTDTSAPFEYNWNTKSVKDRTHTITVKGCASGVFMADDTITVTVSKKSIAIHPLRWSFIFLFPFLNLSTFFFSCFCKKDLQENSYTALSRMFFFRYFYSQLNYSHSVT